MHSKTILVIDDEQDIVELLAYNLEKEGYVVIKGYDGQQALEKIQDSRPDLVILDVMMPRMNGLDVCREIRKSTSTKHLPVIMLTARTSEHDQVAGLEIGADDYLAKPISPRVLIARVKTLLRRSDVTAEDSLPLEVVTIGPLEINRRTYTVRVDGSEIFFAKKEFEVLTLLALNNNRVFTREELLQQVWGESVMVVDRTVDVHMSKVRDKLGKYASWIETVKGVGYRFRKQPSMP